MRIENNINATQLKLHYIILKLKIIEILIKKHGSNTDEGYRMSRDPY